MDTSLSLIISLVTGSAPKVTKCLPDFDTYVAIKHQEQEINRIPAEINITDMPLLMASVVRQGRKDKLKLIN